MWTAPSATQSKDRTGPTMGQRGAEAALLVCLFTSSVVQGHNGWSVTYTSTQICALQGSNSGHRLQIHIPIQNKWDVTVVEKVVWFTKKKVMNLWDLRTEAEFAGRVQYHFDKTDCTLRITDLRESDSAEYKFRFITNQPGGKYAGSPGVTLAVTVLQVQVIKTWPILYPTWRQVTCQSSCVPDPHSTSGTRMNSTFTNKCLLLKNTLVYRRISCAVKGYEKFPSPSVCVDGSNCNTVAYTSRSICALKGSSVDISCTYSHRDPVESAFWFSAERIHQRQHGSQHEDLRNDSQYAGRVDVIERERGRSTLRIRDLRESDAAQYNFKLKTYWFEWKNSFPGTTLTVTALQVKVSRIIAVPSVSY
ncbi:uncharacterized protein LOC115780797 isoform X2 [Archocentrus centrarchus]|uniref:uncharacterized protein LOC115780797 isoform X2 n=1 Tax=Archocentrus centrarchus TaxID=63155 RepID=UPI0011EA486B|nr:uncharacterized protein LOC115780797 isoform X2 [Archocentrus centrarchus]